MKRIFIIMMVCAAVCGLRAQDSKQKFSPEQFQADMEQFIVKEAGLTPQESAKFFPVYREMGNRQRAVFDRMRKMGRNKPADEAGCLNAIKQRDKMDLELKKIQQTYHNKFLSIISASKLFDVIRAEERFHRKMLKKSNCNNTHHKDKRQCR